MIWRPASSQERWLALARRLRRSARTAPFAEHTGGWRTANVWSRCAFFVLGLVAALMMAIIGSHLWPGFETTITGLMAIATAEWLILGRRHFHSGIEESLEVTGLSMLAYEGWSRLTTSEYVGAAFLGSALLIAGFRVLSPIFTALSTLCFVLALDAPPWGSGLACYAIGLVALITGRHRFRRPSYDLMLDYLVIVMPVAGYLWSASRSNLMIGTDYLHASLAQWLVPACSLAYAAIALAIGLRRRVHAPLVSCMLCLACCAYELRALTGLTLEARLIAWGCVLLAISMTLERYLRVPHKEITSQRIQDDANSLRILDVAGSAALMPHSPIRAAVPNFEGGGGQFGGGGASGEY